MLPSLHLREARLYGRRGFLGVKEFSDSLLGPMVDFWHGGWFLLYIILAKMASKHRPQQSIIHEPEPFPVTTDSVQLG